MLIVGKDQIEGYTAVKCRFQEHQVSEPHTGKLFFIHESYFRRFRWPVLLLSLLIYSGIILSFGRSLGVSANYIVAFPVIAASLGFGFTGGIIAGTLGLPANLLLFALLGHPEFSPESKLIAQIFGMTVGGSMGLLGNYFQELRARIHRIEQISAQLNRQIQDKEVLVQELHHRVKNNLTLIISLIQMQRNNALQKDDISVEDHLDILARRVRTIASVHDNVYSDETRTSVNLQSHLPRLVESVIRSYHISGLELEVDLQFQSGISLEHATPLSLIILEIVTNSCKHAFSSPDETPRINLYGRETADERIIIISDNGTGSSKHSSGGLGSRIITALARQIRAKVYMETHRGYEYVIKMPLPRREVAAGDDGQYPPLTAESID